MNAEFSSQFSPSAGPLSDLFLPSWQAPPGVGALGTTRLGGVSGAPFDSLNLGLHVADQEPAVSENRRRLLASLEGARKLVFVDQVHGTDAVLAEEVAGLRQTVRADALVTSEAGLALVIMTADCLPVFMATEDGAVVGVAHAGWRGLAGGILESTARLMREQAGRLKSSTRVVAAFGPAIGPDKFEVGPEVRQAFLGKDGLAELFFKPSPNRGKYLANLYGLASLRLGLVDVAVTGQCGLCTVSDPGKWFSYRRDGQTGRQASAVWIRAKIS